MKKMPSWLHLAFSVVMNQIFSAHPHHDAFTCLKTTIAITKTIKIMGVIFLWHVFRKLFQYIRIFTQTHAYKNTAKPIAYTIVQWLNPRQWLPFIYISDLMIISRCHIHILTIITQEMGKLKTDSLIYCIKIIDLMLETPSTEYIYLIEAEWRIYALVN